MLDVWGDVKLADINRERLSLLDSKLREMGRSENTINHYFDVLKTLFNFAAKKKLWAGENPIKDVTPYVVEQKRRAYPPEPASVIGQTSRVDDIGRHLPDLVLAGPEFLLDREIE